MRRRLGFRLGIEREQPLTVRGWFGSLVEDGMRRFDADLRDVCRSTFPCGDLSGDADQIFAMWRCGPRVIVMQTMDLFPSQCGDDVLLRSVAEGTGNFTFGDFADVECNVECIVVCLPERCRSEFFWRLSRISSEFRRLLLAYKWHYLLRCFYHDAI